MSLESSDSSTDSLDKTLHLLQHRFPKASRKKIINALRRASGDVGRATAELRAHQYNNEIPSTPIQNKFNDVSASSPMGSEDVDKVINQLQKLFPDISPRKVDHALKQADGDIGRATAALRIFEHSKDTRDKRTSTSSPASSVGVAAIAVEDFESVTNLLRQRFPYFDQERISNALVNSDGDPARATAALRVARRQEFNEAFGKSTSYQDTVESEVSCEDLNVVLDRLQELFPDISPRRIHRSLEKVNGHVPRATALLRVIQRRGFTRSLASESETSSPNVAVFEDDLGSPLVRQEELNEVQTDIKQHGRSRHSKEDNGLARKATAVLNDERVNCCSQRNGDAHSSAVALRTMFPNVCNNQEATSPASEVEAPRSDPMFLSKIWALRRLQPQSEVAPESVISYPCGLTVDIGEMATLLEPPKGLIPVDLSRLAKVCERGEHMKAALRIYEASDAKKSGRLTWQGGQFYNFVMSVFTDLGFPSPSKNQVRALSRTFYQHVEHDDTSEGFLATRECLCVVDALLQALTFKSRLDNFRNKLLLEGEASKESTSASEVHLERKLNFLEDTAESPSAKSVSFEGTSSIPNGVGEITSGSNTETISSSSSPLHEGDVSHQARRVAYRSIIPDRPYPVR